MRIHPNKHYMYSISDTLKSTQHACRAVQGSHHECIALTVYVLKSTPRGAVVKLLV